MESFFLSETCKYLYLVGAGTPDRARPHSPPVPLATTRDGALAQDTSTAGRHGRPSPRGFNRVWRRHVP